MKLRLSLALILATALPVSASARPVTVLSKEEGRRVLAFMGECVVKREHDLARSLVLSGGDWGQLDRSGKRLIQGECLPKSSMVSVMTNDTMLGSLAEALIKTDGTALPAAGLAQIAPLAYVEPTPVRTTDKAGKPLAQDRIESQQRGIAKKVLANTRLRFGECIVRREPVLSRAVIDTAIETDAELTAIKALAPVMSKCLAPGDTAGFDRETLRGAFAVALYRLSHAATSNGASS